MNMIPHSFPTQGKKIPFFTSSLELNNLESIVKEMESYASSDPEASPADIMKRAQGEWSTITKECTRDNIIDDSEGGLFVKLNMLHLRLIRASIEARVHWAQVAVARFVEQIRSGQISCLQEREKEKSVWWQNATSVSPSFAEEQMIDQAERAYESAATAVQGLRAKDQKKFASIIADLRSTLRRIDMTPQASS